MNLKEVHREQKRKYQECVNRIRFKSIEVDTDDVYNKLWKRIETSKKKIGVSPIWKYISIAACIALLCVSSFLIRDSFLIKPLSYLEVTALAGSKTHVLLPDSTEVWLNGDSWICYPESFDEKSRHIELIGEGFFKVTKDAHRPFLVNLDGMTIQVLGTEFNVLSKKQSNTIETTLLEGSVAIYKESNETSLPDRLLIPGEQAIYDKQNGSIRVHPVQTSYFVSWVTGDYVFEKVTFGQIIDALERSFNVKFHLKDKALKNVYLTAQFTHNESLDNILSILQISMKYKYVIKDKNVFIE